MEIRMKISDEVTVGAQPDGTEIADLASDGFKTVINFRKSGEEDQPLSPDEEEKLVRAAGMEYVNLPVDMDAMGPEAVDAFREKFSQLSKPVFAHCEKGNRAGAMVMMHTAIANGMSGDQTLAQAEQMGFECDVPELKQFVKSYVDSHQS